mmetsp:Transcript_92929/g.258828  ORF Transcript_92929/g.258828 Transcript_92929/m.258828 type:complete len:232 (-) Transcript_92929:607-1302(-)
MRCEQQVPIVTGHYWVPKMNSMRSCFSTHPALVMPRAMRIARNWASDFMANSDALNACPSASRSSADCQAFSKKAEILARESREASGYFNSANWKTCAVLLYSSSSTCTPACWQSAAISLASALSGSSLSAWMRMGGKCRIRSVPASRGEIRGLDAGWSWKYCAATTSCILPAMSSPKAVNTSNVVPNLTMPAITSPPHWGLKADLLSLRTLPTLSGSSKSHGDNPTQATG